MRIAAHKAEIETVLGMTNFNMVAAVFTRWRAHQKFTMSPKLVPEKLMLIVTEVAEAMEAYREDNTDNFSEELAGILIRLLDLCGGLGIDIDSAVKNKMMKNLQRPPKHGKIC